MSGYEHYYLSHSNIMYLDRLLVQKYINQRISNKYVGNKEPLKINKTHYKSVHENNP